MAFWIRLQGQSNAKKNKQGLLIAQFSLTRFHTGWLGGIRFKAAQWCRDYHNVRSSSALLLFCLVSDQQSDLSQPSSRSSSQWTKWIWPHRRQNSQFLSRRNPPNSNLGNNTKLFLLLKKSLCFYAAYDHGEVPLKVPWRPRSHSLSRLAPRTRNLHRWGRANQTSSRYSGGSCFNNNQGSSYHNTMLNSDNCLGVETPTQPLVE